MSTKQTVRNTCIVGYVRTISWFSANQNIFLFFLGISLLYCGAGEFAQAQEAGGVTGGYDGKKFGDICKKFLEAHDDGGYGSLLTAMAGMGAILASAMGGFKVAWSLLVVAIGSFILNTYKDLWFVGTCA